MFQDGGSGSSSSQADSSKKGRRTTFRSEDHGPTGQVDKLQVAVSSWPAGHSRRLLGKQGWGVAREEVKWQNG